MVKLQKRLLRKSGEKEYSKYLVNIPSDRIKELGWKEGFDLKDEVEGNTLKLKPK